MKILSLRRVLLAAACTACITVNVNVFADDTKSEATSSVTTSSKDDSTKTVNKVLFDMCVRGMKEGIQEGLKNDKGKMDSVTQADMDVMVEKVCGCAAPKLNQALLNDDNTEKAGTQEEKTMRAKAAIMSCM